MTLGRAPVRRVRRALALAVVAAGLGWTATVATAWSRCRLTAPTPTVQLRDRRGAFLGEVAAPGDERLGFWPIDEVPPRVAAATLVLEDRRFARHPGVDPLAIARAIRQNLVEGRRISGASTLAMQVARMQDPGPRTLPRKVAEGLTALMLVDRFGREAALREYLTLAPYGNNVHGIGYAARRYFDKPVEDLSWAETALLCAIPQAPAARDPYTREGLRAAITRAERILDALAATSQLSPTDHATAVRELRGLRPLVRPFRPMSTLHPVLALGAALEGHARGGIVVTSLDLELQSHVQAVLYGAVSEWATLGAGNAAAVVVDLATMQVLADVGSTGYGDEGHRGAIDYSRVERYPGSTLKPFVVARALDRGVIDPGTILDDLARGPDGIGNADGRFLGPMLPRAALGNSRNVPMVALTRTLGLDDVFALFGRLGLHDDRLPASHYGLGVTIGGMPTTPLALARAWGALATDGRLRDLGWTADAARPAGTPVFGEPVARWIALALSDPMARLPVFPRMGYTELPFPAAFKTGTSPDHRDAWAVAFTERYLVVTWVGHPDWRPMDGLSGYRAGSRLAREILLLLHPDDAGGFADRSFPPPPGWQQASVCPLSGLRATEACGGSVAEWFPPGRVPTADCAVHRIEQGRPVLDLPPRYAAWQRAAGLAAAAPVAATGPTLGDDAVALVVTSPVGGAEVTADPESPAAWSTLRLGVTVDPPVDEVLWLVDGQPFAVVPSPYEARWPVAPGEHTFQAALPYRPERSNTVSVRVF